MTHSGQTVYLVDDDQDFLEITGDALEGAGYCVERFTDPVAALRRMGETRPDLVISDLMMDRFDAGFSLARQVKADTGLRGVPVIIITAISQHLGLDMSPRDRVDLAAMGADAWLEKPVAPACLLGTVQNVLRAAGTEPGP